jgi:hypothetical protein
MKAADLVHAKRDGIVSVAGGIRNRYLIPMAEDILERERRLIHEVRSALPQFAAACEMTGADSVIMAQDAFAPMLGDYEITLLGKAVKYAGLMGKEVHIVPSRPLPS